ncbi:UNVERIFIED_CONTAM: hypothetical protein HDU68_000013 [Siphonaria sp. JEL0065]|nr:hypothetical protein HDU68_000013 [Siphonaria sp. JEL0065]
MTFGKVLILSLFASVAFAHTATITWYADSWTPISNIVACGPDNAPADTSRFAAVSVFSLSDQSSILNSGNTCGRCIRLNYKQSSTLVTVVDVMMRGDANADDLDLSTRAFIDLLGSVDDGIVHGVNWDWANCNGASSPSPSPPPPPPSPESPSPSPAESPAPEAPVEAPLPSPSPVDAQSPSPSPVPVPTIVEAVQEPVPVPQVPVPNELPTPITVTTTTDDQTTVATASDASTTGVAASSTFLSVSAATSVSTIIPQTPIAKDKISSTSNSAKLMTIGSALFVSLALF